MKVDGKTIPAPQNLKRREAFLLEHKDRLSEDYLKSQLLIIAHTRVNKKLRWNNKETVKTISQSSELEKMESPKKQGFIERMKGAFKAQRGN